MENAGGRRNVIVLEAGTASARRDVGIRTVCMNEPARAEKKDDWRVKSSRGCWVVVGVDECFRRVCAHAAHYASGD